MAIRHIVAWEGKSEEKVGHGRDLAKRLGVSSSTQCSGFSEPKPISCIASARISPMMNSQGVEDWMGAIGVLQFELVNHYAMQLIWQAVY